MHSAGRQIPFDLTFRTAQGREDFLIAPSNKDAVGWIDGWPKAWPAPLLIISGPAASGKSHLANVWKDQSGAVEVAPSMLGTHSAEDIAAMGEHLLIDAVDVWLGDRAAETTLFHLYNILKEEGRTLLVTMRMTPKATPFVINDLASRWRAAPVAIIQEPDDLLIEAVLVKQFADRKMAITHDVLQYILPRMERSFKAAHDVVIMADRLALAEKKPVTVSLMRKVLETMQSADQAL